MSEKTLTVSVAAYNVQDYLIDALESCVVPNMGKLEVIVVDDGSADGTADIAKMFAQECPGTFVYLGKENGGYGSTFNAALPLARGKYFKILDGDDWFDKQSLSGLLDALETTNADLVMAPNVIVDEGDASQTVRDTCKDLAPGVHPIDDMPKDAVLSIHSMVYRTQLLRDVGLVMTEHCFYTDNEFAFLPLPSVETVYVWPQPLYMYRQGVDGQSISIRGMRKHFHDHEIVLAEMLEEFGGICKGEKEPTPAERLCLNRLAVEVGSHYHFLCLQPYGPKTYAKLKDYRRLVADYPVLQKAARAYRRRTALLDEHPALYYPLAVRDALKR